MQQRSYDTGSPTPLDSTTVKIPKSLKADLMLLAADDTRRLAEDLIDIQTKYGEPSIERKTLAPWFTIARLVQAEINRRRKLKSWSE